MLRCRFVIAALWLFVLFAGSQLRVLRVDSGAYPMEPWGRVAHTVGMEFLSEQMDVGAVGVLLLPLLIVAVLVALALVTGLAGRIAMFIEELPHRYRAEPRFAAPRPDPKPALTRGGGR